MDVNGRAGGLELYFGKDVLKDGDGQLTPVLWSGYDKKMKAYQGALLDKYGIQKEFYKKLAYCEAHPQVIVNRDWEDMRAILNEIFTAFHKVDAETILMDVS